MVCIGDDTLPAVGQRRQRTRATLARIREVIGVTEMIPDAVILLDEAGSIETMNSAARSLFNLKKNDIGLGLGSIVRSPDFAAFLRSAEADAPLEFTSLSILISSSRLGASNPKPCVN